MIKSVCLEHALRPRGPFGLGLRGRLGGALPRDLFLALGLFPRDLHLGGLLGEVYRAFPRAAISGPPPRTGWRSPSLGGVPVPGRPCGLSKLSTYSFLSASVRASNCGVGLEEVALDFLYVLRPVWKSNFGRPSHRCAVVSEAASARWISTQLPAPWLSLRPRPSSFSFLSAPRG